jgi:beta-galactosidase
VLAGVPAGVEAVRRGDVLTVINHTDDPVDVPVPGRPIRVGPRDAVMVTGGGGR